MIHIALLGPASIGVLFSKSGLSPQSWKTVLGLWKKSLRHEIRKKQDLSPKSPLKYAKSFKINQKDVSEPRPLLIPDVIFTELEKQFWVLSLALARGPPISNKPSVIRI